MMQFNQYLISIFLDVKDVGIYVLGYKLGWALSFITTAFDLAWLPFVFKIAKEKDSSKVYSSVFNYLIATVIFGIVSLYLFLPYIFKLFVPDEYNLAFNIIFIISLSVLADSAITCFRVGFYISNKPQYLPIIQFLIAMFSLTLNFFVIPRYGIVGTAFVHTATYFLLAFLTFKIAQRLYRIKYEFKKIFIMIIISAIILYMNNKISVEYLWIDIIWKSSLIILYLISLTFIFKINLLRLKKNN
jgi:O-antigen/teichoic acid export membrane protein